MFNLVEIIDNVTLNTTELIGNIDTAIEEKLVKYYEGKCSPDGSGYIKKDSIKLVSKGPGNYRLDHFNAHILYKVRFQALVCNPAINSIIKCKVIAKNQMGLKCEYIEDNDTIIEAYVPVISAGSIKSERDIESVKENEEVFVKVLKSEVNANDPSVVVIGPIVLNNDNTDLNDQSTSNIENIDNVYNNDDDTEDDDNNDDDDDAGDSDTEDDSDEDDADDDEDEAEDAEDEDEDDEDDEEEEKEKSRKNNEEDEEDDEDDDDNDEIENTGEIEDEVEDVDDGEVDD